ncbi:MAG: hypothetical protein HYY29_03785 [Chloroflexi bacterium]|nr:hypothetical protein [Chloroflexota bacterium]
MTQVLEEQPKRKKVAILGFTDSWKLAPFGDPSFEIWGLNELYLFISHIPGGRYDRWFELHMQDGLKSDRKRSNAPPDAHIENLKKLNCPIYMQQHWDDIPNSIPYPMAQICEAFPNPSPGWKPYLTNTVSYMLAVAIMEGFGEIHIYGVDMSHDTEYGGQRPSCEYFVGLAVGRGIKVYIPPVADLLKTVFFYGYEQEAEAGFDMKLKARAAELQAKANALQQELNEKNQALQQHLGALQDCQHMLKNWRPLSPK